MITTFTLLDKKDHFHEIRLDVFKRVFNPFFGNTSRFDGILAVSIKLENSALDVFIEETFDHFSEKQKYAICCFLEGFRVPRELIYTESIDDIIPIIISMIEKHNNDYIPSLTIEIDAR